MSGLPEHPESLVNLSLPKYLLPPMVRAGPTWAGTLPVLFSGFKKNSFHRSSKGPIAHVSSLNFLVRRSCISF